MNEIKFDSIKVPITPGKIDKNPQSDIPNKQAEGVTVTNHMSKLVNLLADGQVPDENARVKAMKQLIQSNEYHVDLDALSNKLLSNGVLKVVGS